MTINRRTLYWGVFFLTLGAVVLAAQALTVDDGVVADVLRLWPLAVIGVGVALLLRRTRFGLAGGMLAAAMPGLLLGGMLVAVPRFTPADCGDGAPASYTTRDGSFGDRASIDLRLACGEVDVTTTPGNGWRLETGSDARVAPSVDASVDRLVVASSGDGRRFNFGGRANDWRLALPTATSLDLSVEIDAGRGQLDLAGARIGDLRLVANAADVRANLSTATVGHLSIDANAASVRVVLPAAGDLTGDLTVDGSINAGDLRICAPDGLGLRVRQSGVLSGTNITGLTRVGDAWETPGYASAIRHADVTATVNVGSVDVNPVGGCK